MTFFIGDPVEKTVVEEIRSWSEKILEKPNKFFNNLPPCPYAKKAWLDDKVAILFKNEDSYQNLYSSLSQWEDRHDLAILVDFTFEENSEKFHKFLDEVNLAISKGFFIDKDMWVMGFHPYDDSPEFSEEAEFEPLVDVEYAMIFVQRLSKLQESAHKIKKNGYYDNYVEEYNASHIFKRREELYRRLKNGNGT
jgi:hypothetical protein